MECGCTHPLQVAFCPLCGQRARRAGRPPRSLAPAIPATPGPQTAAAVPASPLPRRPRLLLVAAVALLAAAAGFIGGRTYAGNGDPTSMAQDIADLRRVTAALRQGMDELRQSLAGQQSDRAAAAGRLARAEDVAKALSAEVLELRSAVLALRQAPAVAQADALAARLAAVEKRLAEAQSDPRTSKLEKEVAVLNQDFLNVRAMINAATFGKLPPAESRP
jgi:septal ring factor EnvC (AmiA/AmiB activator)